MVYSLLTEYLFTPEPETHSVIMSSGLKCFSQTLELFFKFILNEVSHNCIAFLGIPKVLQLSFLVQRGIQQFLFILKANCLFFYS